ncbi:MAG: acyl-CoA dehydratase activase [Spirochaetia bacterium]|nr:acyl-CoA dehydratase activase [Spirochaetia bacterium]
MKQFLLGIDIGSTTAKVILTDTAGRILHSRYQRHNAAVFAVLLDMLSGIGEIIDDDDLISVLFTGTAGMGVAERSGLPFVQEVVASSEVVKRYMPEVRTVIDLGGEDAKIIFFDENLKPDMRMNGNCAGGTGAFIDQMAELLDVPVSELSDLAAGHTSCHSIASRCGVFAKTDIQNLISRDVPAADIAASIYRAVSFQLVSALARGMEIREKILFAGGPFTFQPMLKRTFLEVVHLQEDQVIDPQLIDERLTPEFIPAAGAALRALVQGVSHTAADLRHRIEESQKIKLASAATLPRLFADAQEFTQWQKRFERYTMKTVELSELDGKSAFLGIDSGSTTTKVVLIDEDGRLAFTYYSANRGNPVEAVLKGLNALLSAIRASGAEITIARTASTGYGEDLIKFAFTLDHSYVETIAHYRGAQSFEPDVSFIMDIGGQDMKAIFVRDRVIENMELNESCSSGSGSFIETFAQSMGTSVQEFSRLACFSEHPYDLGSRCTVFMNSKVKQVLREGGELADISAGLAYSVIKNCLNKVLKISDPGVLGDHIVVQGGTFRNPAILRAMELITEREVVRPDRSELMGAWGAALLSRDDYQQQHTGPSSFIGWEHLEDAAAYSKRLITCHGCENACEVMMLSYADRLEQEGVRTKFYTGNKCERIFTNQAKGSRTGVNLTAVKRELILNRPNKPEGREPLMRIGIPRVLNMWEDLPFWNTLFVSCGFEVVLSDPSTQDLAEKGYSSVMSENICFPAKITNGHIINLVEKQVDRIFYPKIRFNDDEYSNALNKYNCPVVTGYPQVIESSIDPLGTYGIPFDNPSFSFNKKRLLIARSVEYFAQFGIPRRTVEKAVRAAIRERMRVRAAVQESSAAIVRDAEREGRSVMLLLGRPYHIDPFVNMKIPEIICSLGFDVITEDSVPPPPEQKLRDIHVLTQWSFPNRLYHAAHWAGHQRHVEVIQLNSFGCGPDAITVDEIKSILNKYGKNPTLIKIDEMTSPGSVNLRVRSLVESIRGRKVDYIGMKIERITTRIFTKKDKKRTVIAPQFSLFYTDFLIAAFRNQGYRIDVLPMANRESIELGLRYSNNDICYPATIVIGDLIKALRSGRYDLNNVAVGLTQTGGQCRASSYVSLLKRALVRAGYDDIPVVTVSTTNRTSRMLNEQPGFTVRKLPFTLTALYGLVFGDVLAKLYYYAAVREVEQGSAMRLVEKYIDRGKRIIDHRAKRKMYQLLEQAVREFNALPMRDLKDVPKVGIVGEIYVKFNPFGNLYTTDWLIKKGIQPEVPPLIDFFLIPLVSTQYNAANHIEEVKHAIIHLLSRAEGYMDRMFSHVNGIMKGFRGELTPFHSIKDMARKASDVIDLVNQFGETWLLSGDIVTFAQENVHTIVCLQPFGCIANHVIAKGVEKRVRTLYPELNLLFLDMDSGMSEVNVVNRMEFLIDDLINRPKV